MPDDGLGAICRMDRWIAPSDVRRNSSSPVIAWSSARKSAMPEEPA